MSASVLTPSDQQAAAIRAITAWHADAKARRAPQVFRLGGYAGTGKTTVLPFIIDALGLAPQAVAACAPTGKAALVAQRRFDAMGLGLTATTVHRAIYFPPPFRERGGEDDDATAPMEPGEAAATIVAPRPPPQSALALADDKLVFELNPRSYVAQSELVIVDEASMVSERLASDLCSYGTPVLAIGDPGQLPPVGGAAGFDMRRPEAMLTEVHRQARDNPIIALSMWIREGRALAPMVSGDGRVAVLPRSRWDDEWIRTVALAPSTRILCGTNRTRWGVTAWLRDALGYREPLPQRGEPVLCCMNSYNQPLVNGSEGVVVDKDAYNPSAKAFNVVVFDAEFPGPQGAQRLSIRSHRRHFDEHIFRRKLPKPDSRDGLHPWRLGALTHFDWGWLLTCHKSQGSQWDNVVVIDESGAFRQDGQRWLYTAATRASERLVVYI